MTFADNLLEQAAHLAHRKVEHPTQASLRRAVSTAYYALFHFLIDEAVNIWAVERHRAVLARSVSHARMKGLCVDFLKVAQGGNSIPNELVEVAQAFNQLQGDRETADYDNSKQWSLLEVESVLEATENAFAAWKTIRTQPTAEDFLMQLLFPKRPKT